MIEAGSPTAPLENRIRDYLPTREVLEHYSKPGPIEVDRKEEIQERLPGAFLSLFKGANKESFALGPSWHPSQQSLLENKNPGLHYSHLAFEGGSLVPTISDNGEVVGANLVLHDARMRRFARSLDSLGLGNFVSTETLGSFSQAIKDLASMSEHVFYDGEAAPTRKGYLRPWGARVTGIGVGIKRTDSVELGAYISSMGTYLEKSAYTDGAIGAAFLDYRRDSEIKGKNAGNYGPGGDLVRRAKALGAHEVACFGPYWVAEDGFFRSYHPLSQEIAMREAIRGGLIVDGTGEDLLYFTSEGELLYMPKNTNILAGTTRQYILDYLAPSLDIDIREYPVSLRDLRSKRVVGAAYVGNAVGFCGVREFKIVGQDDEVFERINLEITPEIKRLTERYNLELSGRVETAGPLLTPVDLGQGRKALEKLHSFYPGWF